MIKTPYEEEVSSSWSVMNPTQRLRFTICCAERVLFWALANEIEVDNDLWSILAISRKYAKGTIDATSLRIAKAEAWCILNPIMKSESVEQEEWPKSIQCTIAGIVHVATFEIINENECNVAFMCASILGKEEESLQLNWLRSLLSGALNYWRDGYEYGNIL